MTKTRHPIAPFPFWSPDINPFQSGTGLQPSRRKYLPDGLSVANTLDVLSPRNLEKPALGEDQGFVCGGVTVQP